MTEAIETTCARVTVGTESYLFDRNALTLTDLYAIKSASGLDFNPFLAGIGEGNPTSLQTLVWFLRHKAGIQGDRLQVDFSIGEFSLEFVDSDANPTAASSGSSVVATSDDSPTTST